MKVEVPAGKYVLAVSGGVDSMALLDLLSILPGVELVVGHFNHGIRPEADDDEAFVARAAASYGIRFESGGANLGPDASEEVAREARYDFLRGLQAKHEASKIITAHHQDDLIETVLINLIRGTGRQGFSAISDNPEVLRPLLVTAKSEIIRYAKKNKLEWREDSTNLNNDYLRNYLRNEVLAGLKPGQRHAILEKIGRVQSLNREIDGDIAALTQLIGGGVIDRQGFSLLPVNVSNEVLVYLLRANNIRNFDAVTIQRLNMAIRTAKADSLHPVKGGAKLKIGRHTAQLLTV